MPFPHLRDRTFKYGPKLILRFDRYLVETIPIDSEIILTKFRFSNHNLMIEEGILIFASIFAPLRPATFSDRDNI